MLIYSGRRFVKEHQKLVQILDLFILISCLVIIIPFSNIIISVYPIGIIFVISFE